MNNTTHYTPQISPELRGALTAISGESLYARILLEGQIDPQELVEDPIDFLGISVNDPSKISYLTQDRWEKIEEDQLWISSRRYSAKPASVLGKIFKKIDYREMECFSDSFKSHGSKLNTELLIVSGESIPQWYDEDNYDKRTCGSLNQSCMKHKSCQNYFDLYVVNSEVIQMLILRDNVFGTLLGRALLWNLGDKKVMDRIYTTNDSVYRQLFKEFAQFNGFYYRAEQNWNSSGWFIFEGKRTYQEISTPINTKGVDRFPYLDTFKFFDPVNGTLYNYKPGDKNVVTLTSSSGSFHPHHHLEQCQEDQNYYPANDVVELSYRNFKVHRSKVVSSDCLKKYIHIEDARYSDILEDHIFGEKWEELNEDIENSDYAEKRKKAVEDYRNFISRQRKRLVSLEDVRSTLHDQDLTQEDVGFDLSDQDVAQNQEPIESVSGQVNQSLGGERTTEHLDIQNDAQLDRYRNRIALDLEQEIARSLNQELILAFRGQQGYTRYH